MMFSYIYEYNMDVINVYCPNCKICFLEGSLIVEINSRLKYIIV